MEGNVQKNGRKAVYTDRPLTEAEKLFAADMENYNCFFRYMRVHKLNQEDWYDILIIGYLQAVKKYISIPKLQEYNFEAILFRTLDSKRGNYWRDLNRQKNMPSGGIVSLDWEMENLDGRGNKIIPSSWIDHRQQTEQECINNLVIIEISNRLTGVQIQIFNMLLDGYGASVIIADLGIGASTYYRNMEIIRNIVADCLSI